jgi:mannan endo-1,4-beta-mannosidase
MIALDDQGHAISMCWHWNAPTNLLNTPGHEWWSGFYTHATTYDIAAALANTNSPEYALLLRDMDTIAVQLRKFADKNIPVLWRPLHESEGGWFWWGAKGAEPFQHHGLHHLIWVLTSEDPAWYPGDDVVDIIGVDAYPGDKSDPLSAQWESLKSRYDGKKLVALTEFGGVPDIPKMHQFGVWFSYFLPWTGSLGPAGMPVETVQRVYQSTNTLTLDEASSRPARLVTCIQTNHLWELHAAGVRGASYRLLAATNASLPPPAWSSLATNKFTGGTATFRDSNSLPQRFYRLVRP